MSVAYCLVRYTRTEFRISTYSLVFFTVIFILFADWSFGVNRPTTSAFSERLVDVAVRRFEVLFSLILSLTSDSFFLTSVNECCGFYCYCHLRQVDLIKVNNVYDRCTKLTCDLRPLVLWRDLVVDDVKVAEPVWWDPFIGGLGRPPPWDTWDTMGYGQPAGGTHPTGMHSCLKII